MRGDIDKIDIIKMKNSSSVEDSAKRRKTNLGIVENICKTCF